MHVIGDLMATGNLTVGTEKISFDGMCIEFKGEVGAGWGTVKTTLSKKWGKACGGAAPGETLDDIISDDLIRRTWRRQVEEEPPVIESIAHEKQRFQGKTLVHGDGTGVLSSVGSDLYDDGPAALAADGAGGVLAVWRKDTGDYDTAIGSRLYTATYDGSSWSAASAISGQVRFSRHPSVCFDGDGNPMVVWSQADSTGLTYASPVQDILDRAEASDIFYSRRTGGVWSAPARVATLQANIIALLLGYPLALPDLSVLDFNADGLVDVGDLTALVRSKR